MYTRAKDSESSYASLSSESSTDAWTMLDFRVDVSEAELLSDLLWNLGVVAIEERPGSSQQTVLRTSMGDDSSGVRARVSEHFPNVLISIVYVDKAIAETWREHAEPTWVTDEVALCPSWVAPPQARHVVFIEPGDTFGLGNHPTTVLALRLGLQFCSTQQRIFDLGCGSGVLAIAVSKILQCDSYVFDIADNARHVVKANCDINQTEVKWQEQFASFDFDVVFANILAPVLISESRVIARCTVKLGIVILSGMRTEQVEKVLLSYGDFTEVGRDELDGWTSVALQKN
ncbi:MAG: methyltransferase [Actinobacteria bacterium]|nr:methyltransferase [Actinomycetota bacterium]MSZ60839.1 methyltransferase [Actinomycetota bacterium]